ncbi:organic hydroperoxide resistance protein [Sphingomonas sp. RB3P16]|uniref:organic hydroperoxide resistance protein n=1 Tax=Parasphingomonas frigoris TaxID=3096163 RepID=UPI002FC8D1FE
MSIMYTTQATALGGRAGTAATADGRLRVELSTPRILGGDDGPGTNPEQLFAAGYAACFLSAIKSAAVAAKVAIANDSNVTASVGLRTNDRTGGEALAVSLSIDLPGLDQPTATRVVDFAHAICPYSNAMRGNVDVSFRIN